MREKMECLKKIGWKDWVFYSCVVGLYIFFAFYFGFVPNVTISSLGINYSVMGGMGSFSHLVTSSILYPYGGVQFEGFGLFFIGSIIDSLIHNPQMAMSLTYLFVFTISYISVTYLGHKLLNNKVLVCFFIAIFYLNPYLIEHLTVPSVGFGAFLISFSLVLDYWIYKSRDAIRGGTNKGKKILFWMCQMLGRLLIVSLGWYTAVIAAVLSCLSLLIYYAMEMVQKKDWKISVYYLCYNVMTWFVSMAIIMGLTPSSVSSFTNGLEVFNGTSVDLVTLFLPGEKTQWISNVIPSYEEVLPAGSMLYGDGTMWDNYLGYALILCAVIGIVLCKEKKEKIALLVTGIVGGVLALGPALKCMVYHNEGTYVYNLSFENQIVFFWKDLFGIFPLSIMRADYRWLLILRIVLIILAFIGLRELWNKKKSLKIVALLLCCVAVIEYYPACGIVDMIAGRIEWDKELEAFDKTFVDELEQYVEEGDLLAICSYENSPNAYMAPYVMERLGTITYAGSGDKARVIAQDYIPENIEKLQSSGNCEEMAYHISEALNKKLCDAVILPFFDMRADSYKWSPSEENVDIYRQFAMNIAESLEGQFEIAVEDYFMVISPKDENDLAYEMIADEELEGAIVKGSTWMFGTKEDLRLSGSEDFEQQIAIENDANTLYVAAWWKAPDEESTVKCTYTFFDDEDQKISEEMLEIALTQEYTKYEVDIPFDEAASYAVVQLQSDDGANVRNVWIQPYQRSEAYSNESEWIEVAPTGEKDLYGGSGSVEQFDVSPDKIESLALEFEVKPETLDNSTLVSKMNYWSNNMTFDCFLTEGWLEVLFSNDGSTSAGLYVDASVLELGEWNKVEILYEDGVGTITVNGVIWDRKEMGYESLYTSAECIEVGADFSGEIRKRV